jgi:SAM-dependent methyltransferase
VLESYGRVARRSGPADVLEPACGSGRLVREMARRGCRVEGFDASEAMLDYGREQLKLEGLTARLFSARLESFRTRRRFDLAHCFVSTFKYLTDEESARSHLEHVARALRVGGVYVLALHLTDYSETRKQRERWIGERSGTRVVCNIQSWPPERRRRRERVRSRLTVDENGKTQRLETEWEFRTYDLAQLRRLLSSVPELEHVTTFDFTYDIAERDLGDGQLDCVLVLRRR